MCQKEGQAAYFKKYREKKLLKDPNYFANKHRKEVYGLTTEEYNKILEFQQGACAICRQVSDKALCIDHNHTTNEVRGLLCYKCNSILGLLNDDEDFILKVIDYLKRTTWAKKLGLTFAQ